VSKDATPPIQRSAEDWKKYFMLSIAFEAGRRGMPIAELLKELLADPVLLAVTGQEWETVSVEEIREAGPP
jgi:hypothetical protein